MLEIAEVNSGQGLKGINTNTETLTDAKGEQCFRRTPRSQLVMRMEAFPFNTLSADKEIKEKL